MLARPITENDIDDRLLTTKVNTPPLDILIRTSGVKRLSDYFLWQVGLPSLLVTFTHSPPGSAPKTHRFTSSTPIGRIWAFLTSSLLY
jgi:undecaprenyl diphosphate synthase